MTSSTMQTGIWGNNQSYVVELLTIAKVEVELKEEGAVLVDHWTQFWCLIRVNTNWAVVTGASMYYENSE